MNDDSMLNVPSRALAKIAKQGVRAGISGEVERLAAFAKEDPGAIKWLVACMAFPDEQTRGMAIKILLCGPRAAREEIEREWEEVHAFNQTSPNPIDVPEWLEACHMASLDEDIAGLFCEFALLQDIECILPLMGWKNE